MRIISVDDHVVEPPHVWTDHMPARLRADAPRLVRYRGRIKVRRGRTHEIVEDDDGTWGDAWEYADLRWPLTPAFAAAGIELDDRGHRPITYDEIRPGCFRQAARLDDMNINGVEASICFPTFPRFCGQTFLERGDRDTSLACVEAYNDWMIDEWCGGDGHGRLIPLTLIPLWDVELAVTEVERCATKGSHAIAFSEGPTALGLPSLYSGAWDSLFAACQDTDTVVNMHIGSSSRVASTGDDSPQMVSVILAFQGAMHAAIDILLSGVFQRFPKLRIALSEGQVGWMPYVLQRLDNSWTQSRAIGELGGRLAAPPSSYVAGHLFGCVFDDVAGLRQHDTIGLDQVMFETDYPHGDSTWPNSLEMAEKLAAEAGLDEGQTHQLLRGNAIKVYRLDRYGITA